MSVRMQYGSGPGGYGHLMAGQSQADEEYRRFQEFLQMMYGLQGRQQDMQIHGDNLNLQRELQANQMKESQADRAMREAQFKQQFGLTEAEWKLRKEALERQNKNANRVGFVNTSAMGGYGEQRPLGSGWTIPRYPSTNILSQM